MTAAGASNAVVASFMGSAPRAYKLAMLAALVVNVLLWTMSSAVAAWAIVIEFIATLALAIKCHPLGPGGLLAIEAVVLRLTSADSVYRETAAGLPIILLLLFMVSAIAFMQQLLVEVFSRLLTGIRSSTGLALLFCLVAAVLSAFLDALTVLAVIMTVATGFYRIYVTVATEAATAELDQFRAALRGLLMHAAVGTALGGICTLVGEPQNLLIGHVMQWDFQRFALEVAPVSVPVVLAGLATCWLVERCGWFGFGVPIPAAVLEQLRAHRQRLAGQRTRIDRWRLAVQGIAAVLLVVALALHWAEVGLIGLALVVLLAAFLGVSDEPAIAEAMKSALPFTALLVVFFAIVAVIGDQRLFAPVVQAVLAQEGAAQVGWMYVANGLLSAISDNVFVATIYISQLQDAFASGAFDAAQYARLAVAVNMGTNLPSVATPNGQAAFLFLLTSSLAPLLRLTYGRMCWMALPYFVVLSVVGLVACLVGLK
jgi:NhaB family Na+:H+ antiporter